MEKDGRCKMDRQNNNAVVLETEKEDENKLAGPLAKKKLSAEGCSRRNGKWKEVRGIRYQMIDNFMINRLYEDSKRKVKKRVKWRRLSLQ